MRRILNPSYIYLLMHLIISLIYSYLLKKGNTSKLSRQGSHDSHKPSPFYFRHTTWFNPNHADYSDTILPQIWKVTTQPQNISCGSAWTEILSNSIISIIIVHVCVQFSVLGKDLFFLIVIISHSHILHALLPLFSVQSSPLLQGHQPHFFWSSSLAYRPETFFSSLPRGK